MKLLFYTALLRVLQTVTSCDYRLTHPVYAKVFKRYLYLNMEQEYLYIPKIEHPNFGNTTFLVFLGSLFITKSTRNTIKRKKKALLDQFNMFWKVVMQANSATEMVIKNDDLVYSLIKANFEMTHNPRLKSMCGIQPLVGPVGSVYTLDITHRRDTGNDGRAITLDVISHSTEAKSFKPTAHAPIGSFHKSEESDYKMLTNMIIDQLKFHEANMFIDWIKENVEPQRVELTFEDGDKLASVINVMANQIAEKTRRGSGNVAWMGPTMVAMLSTMKDVSFAPSPVDEREQNRLCGFVGTLNGRIKIYSSIELENEIIVGYRGATETDAGIIISPYVPAIPYLTVDNFGVPALSIASRYGYTGVSEDSQTPQRFDYYGRIKVKTAESDNTELLLESVA